MSLHHVQSELQRAEPIIQVFGLDVDASMISEEDLRIRVTGISRTEKETYVVEMRFDGYRGIPPFVEFVHPETGELGVRAAYPSCFHQRLCICARYNRKTYKGHSGLPLGLAVRRLVVRAGHGGDRRHAEPHLCEHQ